MHTLKPAVASIALGLSILCGLPWAQVVISPSCGNADAYGQITAKGYHMEVPDCGHAVKHVTVQLDSTLKECVFAFYAHRDQDDDRCGAKDRQRTEIRLNDPKVVNGVTCTHSWKFKLDKGFQPSPSFCHIHQIKAEGGDAGAPMWTLTPRAGSPEKMQIIYSGASSGGVRTDVNLAPFKGEWVEVLEKITFGAAGKYSIVINRIGDGQQLLSYSTASVNNARSGATMYSPKYGIYRSLNNKSSLRDEIVLFADICRAIGDGGCPSGSGSGQNSIRPALGGHDLFHLRSYSGFGGGASINYSLPQSGLTEVGVYNLTGGLVKLLVDEWKPAGAYDLQWDGTGAAGSAVGPGVYGCRLSQGEAREAVPITLR
jgi:hypothetical protein